MFRILVRHFLQRLFDAGSGDESSEEEIGISGILAVLAIPGGFFALTLLDKYSSFLRWMRQIHNFDPYLASIPDKWFFLVLSITVTGLVTVLKWDEILPDRKDHANLAPLPIPLQTIFFAKLVAVFTAAAIFAVDVNLVSSILFPVVVTADKGTFPELVRFTIVHSAIVISASLSTFFSLLAIIGLVMSVIPAASLVVRVLAIGALLVMLCASPAVVPMLKSGRWPEWFVFLPPIWFLGWYQELQNKATPQMIEVAVIAKRVLAGSFALSMLMSLLSYRRFFLRIPERIAVKRARALFSFRLPGWFLRTPFERACFPFAMHTLLRSERHCLTLGAFAAIGTVLTCQRALDAVAQRSLANPITLGMPLLLIYFVITGLRFVIEIPAELNANWIFRGILDEGRHQCRPFARKFLLTLGLPPVGVLIGPALFAIYGWRIGSLLGVYFLLCAVFLNELLLLRYRKIPFTCAFPPVRNHAVLWILLYALGLSVFLGWCSFWVNWMVASPTRFFWMAPFCAAFLYACGRYRRNVIEMDAVLVFEQKPAAAVNVLNLVVDR